MIFGGELNGHTWRYATEQEAELGHERTVAMVRAAAMH
jgi:hypothetical protein